ncbi:MAG: 3-deoxy-D-manno-octulosonic acid transferase [bacterium]
MIRWWLYTVLFTLAYFFMAPYFLFRMKRRGGYRIRFGDRFGNYPQDIIERLTQLDRPVWIHAVSVGEVYVAGQVMGALRNHKLNTKFVLSTTSSTGWKEAEKLVAEGDVLIFYPLDFPSSVKRALKAIKPSIFIMTEAEIWPNMIRACHAAAIPTYLVNARISDESLPGYRLLRFWFKPILNMFTKIFAQSSTDKTRLVDMGANADRIEITGSFKFDVANRNPEKEASVKTFLSRFGISDQQTILLGGSTWPGEEAILIDIFKRIRSRYSNLRLVIVPRHFEKADAVQTEIERAGLRCIRKSKLAPDATAPTDSTSIILADTTGELMGFYGNADIVFVGKSICEHGAQNMIEPCLCGAVTLVGPNTENFRPVMTDLLEAEALIQVQDAVQLEREIIRFLNDPAARRAIGARATAAVIRRTGVVAAVVRTLRY